jgi:hypothetical protein
MQATPARIAALEMVRAEGAARGATRQNFSLMDELSMTPHVQGERSVPGIPKVEFPWLHAGILTS